MAVQRETAARIQFVSAIFTAAEESERPMSMMSRQKKTTRSWPFDTTALTVSLKETFCCSGVIVMRSRTLMPVMRKEGSAITA